MTRKRQPPTTQRMIAELAGVSITTVSRVLNSREEHPGRWAGPETVAAILDIAERSGYRPNPHAASLRTSRSDLVGVLVPRLQDYVLATVYEGIDEAATERRISTFVTNSLDRPDLQRSRTRSMLDRRVDGMIFGDAHLDDPLLDELAEEGVPFVLVSRRRGDHVAVTCDDVAGGRLAAEHLIAQGRTRPAVLAGMSFASTAVDRTRGFLEAYAEAGMPVPPERVIERGFDAAAGREATEEVLRAGHAPDALFATNDFAAIGAMGALHDAGLSVPDDVALVGYNDTPLAASGSIGLTSVRSPVHEMGRIALETLLALVDGREVASRLLEPTLVARASTGPHPA
ncbi:LacI family DNA-binding transcriptional regulator [Clavibacter michiganensis]|uniref:LacI family DNA-binding transcriptional regulator n=1 Tax=Clavibacter michiganensis TaxID=28447 RepID=UPI0026DC148D|nr:LacI family DNA-binding transcriptional regulator [Clavibacter michiganensis]MDO4025461.1 LacI family DNA-binding transcriptional regulator [Clavibacter michiganensis]MDO4035365.1 LacI family DNA-binding transcriptional regulator [Clavibacter michiganensis]MDO4047453.1 LacI family DNA-binding transcriptional regulator [Clavibacter michiganensis]MDO4104844.1 LacI family DNA-binding transcriptional regulator [Clavibacter michiganensis]MDO4133685.1 LacI family DNA-binding transcriptional regul